VKIFPFFLSESLQLSIFIPYLPIFLYQSNE